MQCSGMKITSHLQNKPFQVATSIDRNLPIRKWNHIGTVWSVSSKTAAYDAYEGCGVLVNESTGEGGRGVYEFSDGILVSVGS